jgi:hypothetical protein
MRRISAAFLLGLVAAVAVLPIAAAGAERSGCHCVVRMMCCEDGTCTMGGGEPPATGPEWRGCRREAPPAPTSIDAFERASVKRDFFEGRERAASSRLADLAATRPPYGTPVPATPPPR